MYAHRSHDSRTFSEDIARPWDILKQLRPIAERVSQRLQKANQQRQTVTLKLKSHDYEVSTRQTTLDRPVDSKEALMKMTDRLLQPPHRPKEPVRTLGISVSSLLGDDRWGKQLEFEVGE